MIRRQHFELRSAFEPWYRRHLVSVTTSYAANDFISEQEVLRAGGERALDRLAVQKGHELVDVALHGIYGEIEKELDLAQQKILEATAKYPPDVTVIGDEFARLRAFLYR